MQHRYLVGVSAAVAAHSLLQLGISMSRFRKKAIVIPSQNYAWVIYAGDQVCHTLFSFLKQIRNAINLA